LIPALADEYHVVAPDYPGYGYSSMPSVDEFDYTFDRLAEIVEQFTERIGLIHHEVAGNRCGCRRITFGGARKRRQEGEGGTDEGGNNLLFE
jgi:alpha-beta hydrolase superfamily lysophospholipase